MSTKYFVGVELKTDEGYKEFVLKNDGTYCPIDNVKGWPCSTATAMQEMHPTDLPNNLKNPSAHLYVP